MRFNNDGKDPCGKLRSKGRSFERFFRRCLTSVNLGVLSSLLLRLPVRSQSLSVSDLLWRHLLGYVISDLGCLRVVAEFAG